MIKAEGNAKSFVKGVQTFGTDLESCASAAGSPIIAKALGDFAKARSTDLQAAGKRVNTAMTGTVEAVNYYIKGNNDMALNAQAAAAQAPPPPFAGHNRMGPN